MSAVRFLSRPRNDVERHKKASAVGKILPALTLANSPPSTVVILHDSCYGHRFSRPKTSKANLSMIVERPERIRAGVLGISAAYVRLGERHAGGRHAPHPHNALPSTLPFRIRRTSRSTDINSLPVTNVHGTSWMAELKEMCASAERKLATTGKELVRDGEGQLSKDRLHEGDLYLCPESLGAFQGALGGVFDGVDAVFNGGEYSQISVGASRTTTTPSFAG